MRALHAFPEVFWHFFACGAAFAEEQSTHNFYSQGFEYSRSGNPNRNALEETLASIETGGAFGIAFSSGSSTTATVLQSLGPNAHIISVNDVYGGTFRYMTKVAKINQGLETTFVDLESADDETILAAIQPNTKVRPTFRAGKDLWLTVLFSLFGSSPPRTLLFV